MIDYDEVVADGPRIDLEALTRRVEDDLARAMRPVEVDERWLVLVGEVPRPATVDELRADLAALRQRLGPRPFDASTWPTREGRFLCTSLAPMPSDGTGVSWIHPEAKDDGDCSDGCCDYYRCPACGHRWREECAQ